MRLTCPNCGAQYEVADDVILDGGRDVQCSNCGHVWFQHPAGVEPEQSSDDGHMSSPPEPEPEPQPEPERQAEPEPEPEPEHVAEPVAGVGAEQDAESAPEDEDTSIEDAPVEDTTDDAPALEERRRNQIDPEVEDILRSEAERERAARRAETLESQSELGLVANAPAGLEERNRRETEAARNMARLRGEDATVIGGPIPAPDPDSARRDRLPDIEQINSTLGPEGTGAAGTPEQLDRARRGRGFRLGFGLVTLVAAALAFLYLGADEIGRALPTVEPTMAAYKDAVDEGRLWLDLKVQSLIGDPPAE